MNWRIAAAISALAFFGAAFVTRSVSSLWFDELFTVWIASQPWGEVAAQANVDGFTPPLFYLCVKALSSLGVRLEDLRALPIVFAALAVLAAWDACRRLFGPSSRISSLLWVGGSGYLFAFAHELRPYSALIALTFVVLGRLGGEKSETSDRQAGWAALAAIAFSYLGATLVAIWCWETRRRSSRRRFWGLSAAALAISLPGLSKAVRLGVAWPRVEIDLNQPPPRLSEFIFGLAPAPFGTEFEAALWFLAALASVIAIRRGQADPAFALLLRSLACSLAVVTLLHGVVRTGFAPRYLAVAWCATALIGVGLASSAPRWGVFLSVMVWTANLAAIHGYLKASPQARQDWREAMARFEERLGSRGTLLSFPFHHGAVAAHAYAPGLEVGGGFTSRQAAVYWYDAPTRFSGYGFEGLRRFETAEEALTRIASRLEVCLVSDEPDVTKTATVFGAFKRQGAGPFDTGDPRLRALCR